MFTRDRQQLDGIHTGVGSGLVLEKPHTYAPGIAFLTSLTEPDTLPEQTSEASYQKPMVDQERTEIQPD
ncbi:hypothetical protein UY3_12539 [Chelonia mydas]|uniref:Uncharacterized protein n=1 Tax=Chelonia mydas TaxID=8469 RepID=M7AXW1_CHEMY|nr:hypothetical protein UY3_12539 [Chelonia mydas]